MATKKKLLQAAAGTAAAGGAALNVEDVFSTYLWDGAGGTQTIVNGVDLTEGGLVWAKQRSSTLKHVLSDSERGTTKVLSSNSTAAESTETNGFTSFNSDGFTFGSWAGLNNNGDTYASWTFRKAPKFFDVVTYTGDGVAGRTISHNLGTTVGSIIVKRTDAAYNWFVYHRGMDATAPEDYRMQLNTTDARVGPLDGAGWNGTAPTSTEFTVHSGASVNASGATYVAYLFAHNNGDGDFGPTGDQDIIKCGSYTGTGVSGGGHLVELGFEPQWVMVKRTDAASDWVVLDNMRSLRGYFDANTSDAEDTGASSNYIEYRPTGFKVTRNFIDNVGGTYIYIAIRRGPMAVPTDATDVFTPELGDGSSDPAFNAAPSPIDFFIRHNRSGASPLAGSRLTGRNYLNTSNTAAESTSTTFDFDYMNGFYNSSSGTTEIAWMWKRAPSFCDVVAYTGNGTAGLTVSHNLGVAPEMIWVKNRDSAEDWSVWHKDVSGHFRLNSSAAAATDVQYFFGDNTNFVAPTSTVFTLGTHARVNYPSGTDYIAYLFASLDGVSKVGSFTGNGSTLNVDCGFSSGARFVIIKRDSGPWRVFDTARGIVAGNDPMLMLNLTDAEVTNVDFVDPYSSGFTVNYNGDYGFNTNGDTFYFYAIA